MLVLMGPPFEGTDEQYGALSRATGLVAYELRTKLKPDSWGVVRALADPLQADQLADALRGLGFRVALIDSLVAHDSERRIVTLRGLALGEDRLVLGLSEREIAIPYAAILVVVRGEVQIGQRPQIRSTSSSSTFRAVVPSASDVAVFRESVQSVQLDAYAAADIHFVTVPWIARIDARNFDFSVLGEVSDSPVQDLDRLVDWIGTRANVRVDRKSRVSSLSSFASIAPPTRNTTPNPGGVTSQRGRLDSGSGDDRFDAYSRLVAEAERQTRGFPGA
jgi:hypothetical protein